MTRQRIRSCSRKSKKYYPVSRSPCQPHTPVHQFLRDRARQVMTQDKHEDGRAAAETERTSLCAAVDHDDCLHPQRLWSRQFQLCFPQSDTKSSDSKV
ncbi:uncharacterized protein STEHIDRAFT_148332 [Stereum hirsutum FP-91666 SS1]|uniref:uncharacterized protein n=1 Tax=Stereum hirsutum (strain FP-91666) TaxID=721885 RepID=UPI000444965A|nr:uncharacterized protein STEHIDRAFT_148332 [Stereum hirsutum FP-91666 SS1]EIM85142.1 hypothetical protein STEHIDRAFT_148332 [Stereum hirsutum FP-91666 SS1]